MFTVKNKTIQEEDKTIAIGEQRIITISFQFEDETFVDTDTFTLMLGDTVYNSFAFTNEGFLSFRNFDVSEIITQTSQTFAIKAYNGEDEILSDTITISAVINGSADLSDYYTKTQTDALFNNKLSINSITDATDTIAIAYDAQYDVVQVSNTTNTALLTINPCTGYTATSGKIPTFELWIKPTTTKTTISIANSIKIVGDFPTELESGKIHCFVFRFAGEDQILNYAYSYTPTTA